MNAAMQALLRSSLIEDHFRFRENIIHISNT